MCEDLLHNPENYPEEFNEDYKICCKCLDALETKVKGLNKIRALKRFEEYEFRF